MSIPVIEQRRIEAAVLVPVFRVLVARLGRSAAGSVIAEAVEGTARARGAQWRAAHPSGDLDGIRAFWARLAENGALELDIARAPRRLTIRVRSCAYADMYRRMGAEDVGRILSCGRDAAFLAGYSSALRLERPTCLLDGCDACELIYEESS